MNRFIRIKISNCELMVLSTDGRVEYCLERMIVGIFTPGKLKLSTEISTEFDVGWINQDCRSPKLWKNRSGLSKFLGAQQKRSVQHSIYGKAP